MLHRIVRRNMASGGRALGAAALAIAAALAGAALLGAPALGQAVDPGASGGAPIATSDEGWTIADVEVEASAGTTLAARDAAFRDGQRQALAKLLERLGATGRVDPATVSDGDLDAIVERFQVNAEQSSPGHYAATLTYVFRGEAVQALLAGQSPAAGAMVGTSSSTGDLMPTTNVGGAGALNVLVPLSSPSDWYDIQARLTRLSGVVNVAIASLSAREVVIEIRGGTPETLNPMLAREGLTLRDGDVLELVRVGN